MAGIEFDRQAFVQAEQARRQNYLPILGLVAGVLILAAAGYIGYKLIAAYSPSISSTSAANPPALDQIQQQLAEMDRRLENLEKHRKSTGPEPSVPAQKTETPSSAPAPRAGFKVRGASALPPQSTPAQTNSIPATPDPSLATKSMVAQSAATASAENQANREAWKATSDRLADVVGVVGSQQGEISQTRDDVNRIMSHTVRSAIPFELRRGAEREPVGPVSLSLKSADVKAQRYTVCIYVEDQCVELKNRSVNEVIGFVLSQNSAPLEFVATKILRDQIVGYLEVPAGAKH